MATLIPSDREQDFLEEETRVRNFLNTFHRELRTIYEAGRKNELHRKFLGHVRTIKEVNQQSRDSKGSFYFHIIYMNGTETHLTYDELINEHRMIAVWFSNIRRWPLSFGVWRWTANYGECTLPYDVLNNTNENLEQEHI